MSDPPESLRMLLGSAGRVAKVLVKDPKGKGRELATTSIDQIANIWNNPPYTEIPHQDQVMSAVFSPDGTRVATASADHTACIWDAGSGREISPYLRHPDRVTSIAFSPDGNRVVTGCDDKSVRVWDVISGCQISPSLYHPLYHPGRITSIALSPDGSRVVTGSDDKSVRVWDVISGRQISPSLQHEDPVANVAFSPDGSDIVVMCFGDGILYSLHLWDARSFISLPLKHHRIFPPPFSPDGSRIIAVSFTDGIFQNDNNQTMRVWDVASLEPLSPPLRHGDQIMSAAFSPDLSRIITASADHTARIWDSKSGEPISPPLRHQDRVVSAAFSPDGNRVVTASADHTARIWDLPLDVDMLANWPLISKAMPYRLNDNVLQRSAISYPKENLDSQEIPFILRPAEIPPVIPWEYMGQPIDLGEKEHNGEVKSPRDALVRRVQQILMLRGYRYFFPEN